MAVERQLDGNYPQEWTFFTEPHVSCINIRAETTDRMEASKKKSKSKTVKLSGFAPVAAFCLPLLVVDCRYLLFCLQVALCKLAKSSLFGVPVYDFPTIVVTHLFAIVNNWTDY